MIEQIEYLEPAILELQETINYYNLQKSGLGFEFALEINKTVRMISECPEAWQKISINARKCRCHRFPYNLIYTLLNNKIIIIAVMNTKRDPDYWLKRIVNN